MFNIDTTQALNSANKTPTIEQTSDDAKLKEQTDNFEAMILKIMLDTSLQMDNSLFPKDAGDKIYQSMYKDTLSKQTAGSFGYSELLFNYLKENKD